MQKPVRREMFSLEVPATPPYPYSGCCNSVTLERAAGRVRVSRAAEQLIIAGSPELLEILAGNIEFLVDQKEQTGSIPSHVHIEYYEGHPYLDRESTPLTVTKIPSGQVHLSG